MSQWGGESIHDAILSSIASAPTGHKIDKLTFTWNADGTLQQLQGYQGSELLFTLAFTWNGDGTLASIVRS